MKFDPLFFETLNARTDPPGVVVVGDLSRTWLTDQDILLELADIARTTNPEAYLLGHGAFGFDFMVEQSAELMGMTLYAPGLEEEHDKRFDCRADEAWLLEHSWFVLVFTRREKSKEVHEVDPDVVETAIATDVPIFSVDEKGVVKAWP